MFQNLRFLKTNQDSIDSHSRHGKRRTANAGMQDGHAIEATGGEGVRAVAPHLDGVLGSFVWNKFDLSQESLKVRARAVAL